MRIGDLSFWLFAASWFCVVISAAGLIIRAWYGYGARLFVGGVFLSLSGFVVALLLSNVADTRMSNAFSQFWHKNQGAFRAALKKAHKDAREGTQQFKTLSLTELNANLQRLRRERDFEAALDVNLAEHGTD